LHSRRGKGIKFKKPDINIKTGKPGKIISSESFAGAVMRQCLKDKNPMNKGC
jgi:hypothetical protein